MNNPMQMLSWFPQFMQQFSGQDPSQIVNNLVKSGRITNEQVEQARKMTEQMDGQFSQFMGMFGFRR